MMLNLPRVKVEAWAASFKELAAIDDEELRKARARKLKESIMSSNLLGDGRSHSRITQDDLVPYDPSAPFCIIMTDGNPRLLVLDADSKEAAEFVAKHFPTPTLIQKTLKGAHYFFLLPEGFDISQLKSHAAIHGLEIFTYASHRAIFGGNCDYYTHINNGVTAPRLITDEELSVLLGKKAARQTDSQSFNPSPYLISKANTIYNAISQGNHDAEYLAFLCNNLLAKQIEGEGKKDLRDFDSSSGGRNNLINSIIFTYMRSSVFDTKQKLIDLALCVNSLFSAPLDENEVLALIENKWRHREVAPINKDTSPISQDKPIPQKFIARAFTAKSGKVSTYWLVETTKSPNAPHTYESITINELSSRDAEVIILSLQNTNYSDLSRHFSYTEAKKNKKAELKLDDLKVPLATLTEGVADELFSWRDGVLQINAGYFYYNIDLNKRRAAPSPFTQDELFTRLKSTRFYPLIEKQWLIDPTIRLKFFGDIAHSIKNKVGVNTMCTIKGEGNVGKSWGLAPLLATIFLGKPNAAALKNSAAACVFDSRLRNYFAQSITAAHFLKYNYSPFGDTPLGIIDDDGINLSKEEKELLWESLKSCVKTPFRTVTEKYIKAHTIKNHLFLVRFTNDMSARAPKNTTNNRFYFAQCRQDYDLADYIRQAYPNGEFTITDEEYEILLDFIMYYDFEAAGYIGFNALPPENEIDSDEAIYDINYELGLLKSGAAITSEKITLKLLLFFFDLQNKKINTKLCLNCPSEIDEHGLSMLFPLAQFLIARHYTHGTPNFYPRRTDLYKVLRDLKLPIGAEVRGRIGELMKAYKPSDRLQMTYNDEADTPLIYTEEEDF